MATTLWAKTADRQLVHYTGCAITLQASELRYGAMKQEVAIHAISELTDFRTSSGESTDAVLARFEVLLHRAGAIAGALFGSQLRAWLLLHHLRMPRAAWHLILSPTLGRSNPDEYGNFCQYVRRNGHLHERSGDDQKNMGVPAMQILMSLPPGRKPRLKIAACIPAYVAEPSPMPDDAGDWQSYSTVKSDEGEPLDWTDWDSSMPDNRDGEWLYLACRSAKRKWRSFAGPSRGRNKGRGKAFWTDGWQSVSCQHVPFL